MAVPAAAAPGAVVTHVVLGCTWQFLARLPSALPQSAGLGHEFLPACARP